MATTVYYHTTPTCAPCVRLKPMARSVAEEAGVTFIEVDISSQPPLVAGILSVPTVVIRTAGEDDVVLGPQAVRKARLQELLLGDS